VKKASIPQNEKERLESLRRLNILDTPPEERFDRITSFATFAFDVPISKVTLIDSDREWFKSCQGLSDREGKRAISFCNHALLADDILIIPDTHKDHRFADNPMVVGKPFIRFYSGVPLFSTEGYRVGTFCIKDCKPREFSEEEIEQMKSLASWSELELNLRKLNHKHVSSAKLRDITALKVLNKMLRHGLLDNLSIVRNTINTHLEYGEAKYSLKEMIDDMSSTTERTIEFIERMHDLEKAVSTGSQLRSYSVAEVLREADKSVEDLGVKIKGDARVLADDALCPVIVNLIRNARIHGKVDVVDVSIEQKGNFAEVRIADNGIGIPDKIKDKLFQEGFKYGKTGHTGLGLYIVRKTMERYGGNVRVEDNKPEGAVFILQFQIGG
jgi:two-component sensor histidine kinase